jgi:dCTP diphosphatase
MPDPRPSSDHQATIESLKAAVRAFSRERDWEQFHHPKDLGIALVCEVGELFEHLRYRTHDEIRAALGDAATRRAFSHELADCLWLLLRLADVTGIDLADSLREKLDEAARKYPVDRCHGRPDKYTAYAGPGPGDG